MAYEKQTWKTGDKITEEKLNHMEDGIGSCVMVVGATTVGKTTTLDKTWQEIHDAIAAGKILVIVDSDETYSVINFVTGAYAPGGSQIKHQIDAVIVTSNPQQTSQASTIVRAYLADNADSYPAFTAVS